MQTRFGNIPVMRVQTRQGRRVEPVTYWIRVGDKLARGAIEQNLARVQVGLRGRIPDGLLFRVSSIEDDTVAAYQLQDQFVDDLIGALDPVDRSQFIGDTVSSNSATTNLSGVTRVLKD
ncbi:MAG: methanolan biosynthesis protein EpsI, partial [Firmicutes bacterium]|nr:methanolan biosynthesis protein EpsI [Bacillota bacterium]